MCEFYQVGVGLSTLIEMTSDIFTTLSAYLQQIASSPYYKGPPVIDIDFSSPQIVDFIPALESCLGFSLPDLTSPTAYTDLLTLCNQKSVSGIVGSHSLPQLLNKLGSAYLDPLCHNPTFIIHFPECMCPLAKSFIHPTTGQRVAANADFVVRNMELVNICEEENDPQEQRRKLEEQQARHQDIEGIPGDGVGKQGRGIINEAYLKAMRTGLPPTGGFGCGIERVAMLMTGSTRLRDVLTFGTLRNTSSASKI